MAVKKEQKESWAKRSEVGDLKGFSPKYTPLYFPDDTLHVEFPFAFVSPMEEEEEEEEDPLLKFHHP